MFPIQSSRRLCTLLASLADRLALFLVATIGSVLFAGTASAQVTSLTINSDPGDYVGNGQFSFFTPADGSFFAQSFTTSSNPTSVEIYFHTNNYEHTWDVQFTAPTNQLLGPGNYPGAVMFNTTGPSLMVAGDSRQCNQITGSFTVLEASYSADGTVNSFDATFTQQCFGATAGLRGEVRYNAHPIVDLTAPQHVTVAAGQPVNFSVSATDTLPRRVYLSATGLPSGATFVDHGNSTGTFNWSSSRLGSYFLTLQGDNHAGNVATTYTEVIATAQNDDFNNATIIRSFPYTGRDDVSTATAAPDDPSGCCGNNQSVWYSFTPATNMRVEANTFGSNYDTALTVFTGLRGALNQITWSDDTVDGSVQSRVRFDAMAGTHYYFMASAVSPASPANLVLNLLPAPPLLTIVPIVSQFASVNPTTGAATVYGTVKVSKPSAVTISGQLKQVHGQKAIDGWFAAGFICNAGTTSWSAPVTSAVTLFHGRSAALFTGGKASVTGGVFAYDFDNGEFVTPPISADVTLRGKQ
jgi:hypothetical protein